MNLNECPVCELEGLMILPGGEEIGVMEDCVRCGTRFGHDDAGLTGAALRERWAELRRAWVVSGRVKMAPPSDPGPPAFDSETTGQAERLAGHVVEMVSGRGNRLTRFFRNCGWKSALYNTLILVYLVLMTFMRGGTTVGVIVIGVFSLGFFAPLLVLGLLLERANKVFRVLRMAQMAVIGVFLLEMMGVVDLPTIGWIGLLVFGGLFFGTTFWVMSDRRIWVNR